MKKTFVFLILLLIQSAIHSDDFKFKINPVFNYSFGQINEKLYNDGSFGTDSEKLASCLEWKQNKIYSIGINFDFTFNNIFLKSNNLFSIPLNAGEMHDSDWNSKTIKTTYSIHEEQINTGLSFEILTGYSFNFQNYCSISPTFSIQYDYTSLSARNGYGWYGSSSYSSTGKEVAWNDPAAHYYPDGVYRLGGIDFDIHKLSFYCGMEFSKTINPKIKTSFSAQISPFTYINATDHHLNRNTGGNYYNDIFTTCFTNSKLSISGEYKITEHFGFNTSITNSYAGPDKGKEFENGYISSQEAAFENWTTSFSIGMFYLK